MNEIILVAGATGGVGQQIVKQLLEQGKTVRVLARDPARARQVVGQQVEIAPGDTRRPETLPAALQGVRFVLCATGAKSPLGDNRPERVDYEGVRNLAQAALQAGVEHFVLVSSCAVTHPNHPLNQFGRVLDWKLKGENALRASGLSYTIVRPGGLNDSPGGQKALRIDQGDRLSGMVSRADVAAACIAALGQPAACNVTFEMINANDQPSQNWENLFKGLMQDQPVEE